MDALWDEAKAAERGQQRETTPQDTGIAPVKRART
jgi:hypothetical protein